MLKIRKKIHTTSNKFFCPVFPDARYIPPAQAGSYLHSPPVHPKPSEQQLSSIRPTERGAYVTVYQIDVNNRLRKNAQPIIRKWLTDS